MNIGFIHPFSFLIRQFNLKSSQSIYNTCQGIKIHCHITVDVQIQVAVEHLHRLVRPSVIVSVITLLKCTVPVHIHGGIPVDGHQFHFLGLIINIGKHDHVAVSGVVISVGTVVHTEDRNGRVALHQLPGLLIQRVGSGDQLRKIDHAQLGSHIDTANQQNKNNQLRDQDSPSSLFSLSHEPLPLGQPLLRYFLHFLSPIFFENMCKTRVPPQRHPHSTTLSSVFSYNFLKNEDFFSIIYIFPWPLPGSCPRRWRPCASR